MGTGLAGRNDANDVVVAPVAVAHHQKTQRLAQTQENKAIFIARVIRVVNQLGALILED